MRGDWDEAGLSCSRIFKSRPMPYFVQTSITSFLSPYACRTITEKSDYLCSGSENNSLAKTGLLIAREIENNALAKIFGSKNGALWAVRKYIKSFQVVKVLCCFIFHFVDPSEFTVKDNFSEDMYDMDLKTSLQRARTRPLLKVCNWLSCFSITPLNPSFLWRF